MIVERERDVKTVFKPNDKWWDVKDHNLTEVIFTPISSDATRVAALLSGEIDMMYPVPVQDTKRIDSNAGTSTMVGPNCERFFSDSTRPLTNLPVRASKGKPLEGCQGPQGLTTRPSISRPLKRKSCAGCPNRRPS